MNLYTLTSEFLRNHVIDTFSSVIWTDRYATPGDVVLTCPPTTDMIAKLAEGTFLALDDSKEVMLIETQSIENGELKVEGTSLLNFLKERIIRASINHDDKNYYIPGMVLGERLGYIVQFMLIDGIAADDVGDIGHDGIRQVIPNLTLGAIDMTGDVEDIWVPYGSVYDGLIEAARGEMGMSLYLDSADELGYSLKFTAYKGRDLSSDQSTYPVVRFSPVMDSLTNIKELRSISGYKNVVYAFSGDDTVSSAPGIAYDGDGGTATGFARRVLMLFCDDLNLDEVGGSGASLTLALENRARDALANHTFTRVVDGEITPQSQFQYGIDYDLGDIVELQGHSGLVQKARITEYIRSKDATGERAYPTVSVITD